MRVVWISTCLLLLGACPSPGPTTGPTTNPSAPRSDAVREVRIAPDALRIDSKAGVVWYRPGRNVKRARYLTYRFALDEYRRFAKGARSPTLRVEVLRSETRTRKLPPDQSQPMGGFRISELTCRILARVR